MQQSCSTVVLRCPVTYMVSTQLTWMCAWRQVKRKAEEIAAKLKHEHGAANGVAAFHR